MAVSLACQKFYFIVLVVIRNRIRRLVLRAMIYNGDTIMENIYYRRAEIKKDKNCIAKLWHDVYHESHANLVPSELLQFRTLESFAIRAANPSFIEESIVAIKRGDESDTNPENLVGFITTRVETHEIYQFFVHKEARGLGVAKELISRAEDDFKSFQKHNKSMIRSEKIIHHEHKSAQELIIHLYASVGNSIAKRFYEKNGWRVVNDEMFQAEIVVNEGKNTNHQSGSSNESCKIQHFPVHCYRFEKNLIL